jgi:hypothetical protein
VKVFAKGILAAKMWLNTEEFQAFRGRKKLAHNLEVAGSNPVPATFENPRIAECDPGVFDLLDYF